VQLCLTNVPISLHPLQFIFDFLRTREIVTNRDQLSLTWWAFPSVFSKIGCFYIISIHVYARVFLCMPNKTYKKIWAQFKKEKLLIKGWLHFSFRLSFIPLVCKYAHSTHTYTHTPSLFSSHNWSVTIHREKISNFHIFGNGISLHIEQPSLLFYLCIPFYPSSPCSKVISVWDFSRTHFLHPRDI
jgi:hypothetical protein